MGLARGFSRKERATVATGPFQVLPEVEWRDRYVLSIGHSVNYSR